MPAYDVAVIGAGIFGAWTSWHLCRTGKSVLLLDAWSPGHSRSSSGGESRIIRMGYGADEIYTRMAMRSLEMWREFCRDTGEPLFVPAGVLWMARESDPYSTATLRTLRQAGVPIEVLDARALKDRYPQMRFDHSDVYGILEPGSGALMARRAVDAVVRDAVRSGLEWRTGAVLPPDGTVRTSSGEMLQARTFVFACGAWLPKLFPVLLGRRIHPTRQEVFFFAPPPGDSRFGMGCLPVWIDFTHPAGPYGFPDLEGRGFKLAIDRHGPPFDPDLGDRRIDSDGIAEAQRFLADRFPALKDAPLSESRVCQYENTSNGDFLIDRHPEHENWWLIGGGSGHGFKHGPAIGEYAAAQILHGGRGEPRFSLSTKEETQRRTVY
jgi:sarcosine oxidase